MGRAIFMTCTSRAAPMPNFSAHRNQTSGVATGGPAKRASNSYPTTRACTMSTIGCDARRSPVPESTFSIARRHNSASSESSGIVDNDMGREALRRRPVRVSRPPSYRTRQTPGYFSPRVPLTDLRLEVRMPNSGLIGAYLISREAGIDEHCCCLHKNMQLMEVLD